MEIAIGNHEKEANKIEERLKKMKSPRPHDLERPHLKVRANHIEDLEMDMAKCHLKAESLKKAIADELWAFQKYNVEALEKRQAEAVAREQATNKDPFLISYAPGNVPIRKEPEEQEDATET